MGRGRPPLLTYEIQKTICDNLVMQMTQEDACTLAGVPPGTFYDWKHTGNEERQRRQSGLKPREKLQIYVEFAEAIEKARAQGKRALIGRIVKASETTWQAAAWTLERRYPREFGQRVFVEKEVARELENALDIIKETVGEASFTAILAALSAADSQEPAGD
jgi:hypothetical protein